MNLQNKIICALGDSITEGVGVSAPDMAWEMILGRLVGARTVHNYGVSGTRFALQTGPDIYGAPFVERYLSMPDDADVILVFGATNDYGHGNAPFGTLADRTPDTFCGACHTLFLGLIEKYPASTIVIITPTPRMDGACSGNTGRPLVDYVDTIKEIAAYYALPVLDLYRTVGVCPTLQIHRDLYMPDGLHPNDAGATRIAERVAGFLTAL